MREMRFCEFIRISLWARRRNHNNVRFFYSKINQEMLNRFQNLRAITARWNLI